MKFQILKIVLWICITNRDVIGSLTRHPQNQISAVGYEVKFICGTDGPDAVNWLFLPLEATDYTRIVSGGTIANTYRPRATVAVDDGLYNLVLHNVTLMDSGEYKCIEELGLGQESRTAQLIVLESIPLCSTNMPVDGYLGDNSCGLSPDIANISCSVRYRGQFAPVLALQDANEMEPITGVIHTSLNTSVTVRILLPANQISDGARYVCSVMSTVTATSYITQSDCQTRNTVILDNQHFARKLNTCGQSSVTCSARVTPHCTYHWIDLATNKSISEIRELSLQHSQGSTYALQCLITCPIHDKMCTFDADIASCNECSTTVLLLPGILWGTLATLAVENIILAVYFIVCKRRRKVLDMRKFCTRSDYLEETESLLSASNSSTDVLQALSVFPVEVLEIILMKSSLCFFKTLWKTTDNPKSIVYKSLTSVSRHWLDTINRRQWFANYLNHRLNTMFAPCGRRHMERLVRLDADSGWVRGVAQLQGRLFIITQWSDTIRVFSSQAPYTRLEDIVVTGMRFPNDITSCSINRCLYVADWGCCVWRINSDKTSEELITKRKPYKISVLQNGMILLTGAVGGKVSVFTAHGDCLLEISLPREGVKKSLHAVGTANGNIIICQKLVENHGYSIFTVNRGTCQVDRRCDISRGYLAEQLASPCHIALEPGSGRLFLADRENHRVILVDRELGIQRVLLSTKDQERPCRLCYIPEAGQLAVGLRSGDIETGRGFVDIYHCRTTRMA